MRKRSAKRIVNFSDSARASASHPTTTSVTLDLVIATRMSRELGISPVTFWRWRHSLGFPPGTRINRRIYFSRSAIRGWLDRQQQAA